MRAIVFWVMVTLGIVLGLSWEVSAEIYSWTDEQGVVHMTDQWTNVPEPMRSRVSVRESSPQPSDSLPASRQAERPLPPVEPQTVRPPTLQPPPDLGETPSLAPPSSSAAPYVQDTPVLIPNDRPFVRHPRKLSPPFPYNVRLDPFDQNFVWVGPNRVPKDAFTYPHVSLDEQAKFHDRVRALEQRKSGPHRASPAQPVRP
jgi:hypothetical protein